MDGQSLTAAQPKNDAADVNVGSPNLSTAKSNCGAGQRTRTPMSGPNQRDFQSGRRRELLDVTQTGTARGCPRHLSEPGAIEWRSPRRRPRPAIIANACQPPQGKVVEPRQQIIVPGAPGASRAALILPVPARFLRKEMVSRQTSRPARFDPGFRFDVPPRPAHIIQMGDFPRWRKCQDRC